MGYRPAPAATPKQAGGGCASNAGAPAGPLTIRPGCHTRGAHTPAASADAEEIIVELLVGAVAACCRCACTGPRRPCLRVPPRPPQRCAPLRLACGRTERPSSELGAGEAERYAGCPLAPPAASQAVPRMQG